MAYLESEILNLDAGGFGIPSLALETDNKQIDLFEKTKNKELIILSNLEEELDETFGERLIGLTEMFPESVRNLVGYSAKNLFGLSTGFWRLSRQTLWIIFSSATILVVPLTIETTRQQMEYMHIDKQRQVLLGPTAMPSKQALNLPIQPL